MTTADRQVVREVREFLRERLGGTDGIRGHVLSEALRDREEVERQISAMEAELASADGRWLEVQSLVTKLVQAGADMTALPMVLADVAAARDARQAIAGVLSAAMDRRQMIDAGLRSSSAEIDAVVERITLGLELVEGPERQPEHVADALFVLRALVEKVVVSPERDLTVFLRQDAASLFRVFADILKTAVEGHRLDRGLGLVIQDSKP